jgi:hypothetical protein
MRAKQLAVSLLCGALAIAFVPRTAAAQCEGGTTVAGYYAPDGRYVPGHCAQTNPATTGQLYPSGAQPLGPLLPTTSTTGSPTAALGSLQSGLSVGAPTSTRGTSGLGLVTSEVAPPAGVPTNTARQTLAGQTTLPDQLVSDGLVVPSRLRVIGDTTGLRDALPAGLRLDDAGFLHLDNWSPTGVVTTSSGRRILGSDVQLDLFNPSTAVTPGSVGRPLTGLQGIVGQREAAFTREGDVLRITVLEVVPEGQTTGTLPNGRIGVPTTQNGTTPRLTVEQPAIRIDGPVSEVRGRVVTSSTLPEAPAVNLPPTPGRGGPTYLGEEGPDDTIVTYPNR